MSDLVPDAGAGDRLDRGQDSDALAETAAAAMKLMATLLRNKVAHGSATPEREVRQGAGRP